MIAGRLHERPTGRAYSADSGTHVKVEFKVLCFSKGFTIIAHYTARPGSDLVGLMESAEGNASRTHAASRR